MGELKNTAKALSQRQIAFEGDWTAGEQERILSVLERIEALAQQGTRGVFNGQATTFRKSGRPGRAGRTLGGTVELDGDWTDWTLAHELGHRWNNAWRRTPERDLRTQMGAGGWEWLKRPLRRFEKSLERFLKKLGITKRLDWRALWYHPGQAAPPCGADRNFNASEDLAESFAASVFPQDAKERAAKASKRLAKADWDWGEQKGAFSRTQRGEFVQSRMRIISMIDSPGDKVA
jgi:hypothetical protein